MMCSLRLHGPLAEEGYQTRFEATISSLGDFQKCWLKIDTKFVKIFDSPSKGTQKSLILIEKSQKSSSATNIKDHHIV